MSGPLIRIGYWRGAEARGWPDPALFVDPAWDADERELVARYLRHGLVARAYLGMSACRLCGRTNGSLELTDGSYLWPDGLAHYLEDHHVRLPARFVDHVRRTVDCVEQALVEDGWWMEQAGPA